MRATLIRRPALGAATQRFRLPWHAFRLSVSGSFCRDSTTRLDDGPAQPLAPRPGGASFYPAGTDIVNQVTGTSRLTYLMVEIDDAVLHGFDESLQRPTPLVDLVEPVCLSLLDRLRCEVERGTGSQRLFFDTAALMLLLSASGQRSTGTGEVKGGLAPITLARVKDYIVDHLADEIALGELAGLVGLSPWHLCRAFKASTGVTPHGWQLRARIEHAQRLLLRGGLPICAVAVAAGFADQSHFTTVFRRLVGQPPERWRRGQS